MSNEEIQIGADTSGAVRDINALQSAVNNLTKTLGLNSQQSAKAGRDVERAIANMAAAHIKNASAAQRDATAGKQNAASMEQQAAAAKKLAEEEKRVFAALGLARNAGNRVINTETGRFATKDQIGQAQNLLALYQRQGEALTQNNALDRMRSINAQNAYAAEQKNLQIAREQTAEYKLRQAQLQKAFASPVIGLANPDASRWERLRNVLNQIPPVTWVQRFGAASDALMAMDNSARYALYSVAAGAGIAGAAIGGIGVLATKAAIEHERAFANVERTTQTTTAGYEVLRRQLELMSMEIPVTFDELTKIASAAGQLGISAAGVENFTKTVAMLTATTNLTSDAAGNALARFRAFFSESSDPRFAVTERTFSNLASSILKVGVNSIATESGIVNVATQISSMGQYAGFTADQVIGLAGALSSIGVAPELARGITTRLFTIMGNAVSEGGVQLEKFAAIAGMSATDFKAAWGTQEMGPVFTSLLQGLDGIQKNGGDANQALMDLGITAVRDRPVWLRLANAADETGQAGALLAQTMQDAREGWIQNIELGLQYSKISETAAARIQVMTQAFEQLFAALGEESGNFLGEIAVNVTELVKAFEAFAQSDVGKVFGVFVTQGAFVVGAILLVVGSLAGLAATVQGVGTAFTQMGATGIGVAGRLTAAFRIASLALGAVGLIGTLVAVTGTLVSLGIAAEENRTPIQDMGSLVAAMREDAENGATGLTIWSNSAGVAGEEAAGTKQQADSMAQALYDIRPAGEDGAAGLDRAADAAQNLKYVFGPAAREVAKSQLLMDEAFQRLFDSDVSSSQFLSKFKIKPELFDWDAIIDESLREGGNVVDVVLEQMQKQTNVDVDAPNLGAAGFQNYAAEVAEALAGTRPELLKQIAAQEALAGNTNATTNQMIDDYELLEDAQKKTIDKMAAGLAEFTNPKNLIELTQQWNEIFEEVGGDQEKLAEAWGNAWDDAYGGSAFKLEEYMGVFRQAAGEQTKFIEGLQQLGNRGLSTAIIEDLAAMGPEASKLVGALVTSTDEQLAEFETLWGQTGYDSMVKFATQAAIGQEIVNNIMRTGGLNALKAFNEKLASGVGVDQALSELQRDVDGNPVEVRSDPYVNPNWQWMLQNVFNQGVRVPVTPYLTQSRLYVEGGGATAGAGATRMYIAATGGHITGPGSGTSDSIPAMLSNGEFVMTARSVRNIGVRNLYDLMRSAEGRKAPRGYATGGLVGSSGSSSGGGGIVHLSVEDRKLLIDIREAVGITVTERSLTATVNSGNAASSARRSA